LYGWDPSVLFFLCLHDLLCAILAALDALRRVMSFYPRLENHERRRWAR
jgi:hypothetical protein